MPFQIKDCINPDELKSALQKIDISVPGRVQGRTTEHTENWSICRLLSTLLKADLLEYPLSLTHTDRPDFLLEMGPKKVGIEVTEAIPERYAAYCALAEREFPDALLEPSLFGWGSPKRTYEEMRTLLSQQHLVSDGWSEDQPEREWALFIQDTLEKKLTKLAHPEFNILDQNWLAIYDNLPLANVYLAKAVDILKSNNGDHWSRVPNFMTIFIERGPVIAHITPDNANYLVVDDLWG